VQQSPGPPHTAAPFVDVQDDAPAMETPQPSVASATKAARDHFFQFIMSSSFPHWFVRFKGLEMPVPPADPPT